MVSTVVASKAKAARKQCWECHRRRLVCDSSLPGCNKCRAAGVECPGYGEKKPLKWLTPGKVTSHTRQRRVPLSRKGNNATFIPATASANSSDTDKPADLSRDRRKYAERGMVTVSPPTAGFKTEACDAIEAISYFNTYVYPSLVPIHDLAPNPYLFELPLNALHYLPLSVSHSLTFLALSHRFHQLQQRPNPGPLVETRSRLYHHRGEAIRAIGQDIARACSSNATIISVLEFFLVDTRQNNFSNWHAHVTGAMELIKLRGGLENLIRSVPYFKLPLLCFVVVIVMGNTTSPASGQIAESSHVEHIDIIMSEMYGDGLFPCLLCPPPLFLEIININHIRSLATDESVVPESARSAADAVLNRIDAFMPVQFAGSKTTTPDEWLLLGSIHQSTVALYCISSLQSLSFLTVTSAVAAMRTTHRSRLFSLLKKATVSKRIKIAMVWPLIVAGTEAVHTDSPVKRNFVEEQLLEIGREQGSPVPLQAIEVLQKFWRSGKTRWDDCFDRPYTFIA